MNKMADFLTHLFDVWNTNGIRYLILRNYEELPEFTDNDIDILLAPDQRASAEVLLVQAASEKGWHLHNVGEFACRALWLFNQKTLEQVHIDLMCGIRWHTFQFADYGRMLERRVPFKNFYIPTPEDESAVSLLTRLVYGGYVKEKYKEGIRRSALGGKDEMVRTMRPWAGGDLAEKLVLLASEEEWAKIEETSSLIRKAVVVANLKKPFRLARSFLSDSARLLRRWIKSPGFSVVFFGPDGCGKTSVANGLKERLGKTFPVEKGLHCHWKPIRPKGESSGPIEDPHGKLARSLPASVAYFVYHYLPFIWGWWRYVKPVLFKSGLVIIDRYYYDFFVDQRRYRLNLPQWIVKLGFVFVKKPDLVVCLDANSEILQARKAEVSFEECKRQREAYYALAEKLPNGRVIDASLPLEQVVTDVQTVVLETMAERTTQRVSSHKGTAGGNFK